LGKPILEIGDYIQTLPPSIELVSTVLWLLLIDEDPALTIQGVSQILKGYVSGAGLLGLGWRTWRLNRAFGKYSRALKEFAREFGG
jgi:hypothetical protein